MHLNLVLQVSLDIRDQKVIALVNELLVERIIDARLVHPVLDEEHGKVLNSKTGEQSLVLSVAHTLLPVK